MFESFYNNLIAENRYRMILDGLQVTLLIGGMVCYVPALFSSGEKSGTMLAECKWTAAAAQNADPGDGD